MANGYASLDATGKVPSSQLPASGGDVDVPALAVSTTDTSTNLNDSSGVVVAWTGTAQTRGTGISHSSSTNNTRITFDSGGWRMISADLAVVSDSNSKNCTARLRLNGTTFVGSQGSFFVGDSYGDDVSTMSCSAVLEVSAGDYVEVVCTRDGSSYGDVNLVSGASQFTAIGLGGQGDAGPQGPQGPPGGGATDLDDLTDVAISSPASGQLLRHNGTSFVNAALAASDLPGGIDTAKIGSGSVNSTEFSYLNGVSSPIQSQLNGKAASSHTHSASSITSGILPVTRGGTSLGSISANKLLGSGSSSNTIQSISLGSGLSLSGGVLSNTASSGVPGFGSDGYIAIWSGTGYLTYTHGYPVRLRYPRNLGGAGGILYLNPSDGEVFYQYSRAAHKTDVKNVSTSIDDLMKWRAVEFQWKENFGGEPDVGLIAEEVAAVYPRAATYDQPWEYTDDILGTYAREEDGAPKRLPGNQVPAGVKYEKAWIPMLAAVQDFYKRFQALSQEVKSLKAKLGDDK
jgi:hypothetical protein